MACAGYILNGDLFFEPDDPTVLLSSERRNQRRGGGGQDKFSSKEEDWWVKQDIDFSGVNSRRLVVAGWASYDFDTRPGV